jgi:ribosomal protein S18 acetylase RimI-like enzyme
VARSSLHVRPATREDLPALLELGAELREQLLPVEGASRSRPTSMAGRAGLAQRYTEAVDDPDRHLVLVTGAGDEVLGMALLTVGSANALLDLPAVHMSHAVVPDRHRRRGVGKALVAAAATFAEDRGIEQLVVSVHPGSREAARFFARLGFAPMAVRRAAPVAVVRRHLGGAERPPAQLVRRRPLRTQRVALPATGTDGPDS